MSNANVASGQILDINGGAGASSMVIDATAEGDGNLNVTGTGGNDTVTLGVAQAVGTFDLGGGTDVLTLGAGFNTLTIQNTETVQTSSSAGDSLTLVNGLGGGGTTFADLGGGGDTLNLADANNTISATGFEIINGGTGDDVIDISSDSVGTTITGGAGTDTFSLGSGADIVIYDNTTDGTDTINGFTTGSDTVSFNAALIFNGDNGVLAATNFVKGAGATAGDADDFYIFDTTTSTLKYDADGSGAGAAVDIATFDNNDLVNTDISIFGGVA